MTTQTMTLHFSDITGQRAITFDQVDREATFGEITREALAEMNLLPSGANDGAHWAGLLEREGRHVHSSEIIGDVLKDGDQIELSPEIIAG